MVFIGDLLLVTEWNNTRIILLEVQELNIIFILFLSSSSRSKLTFDCQPDCPGLSVRNAVVDLLELRNKVWLSCFLAVRLLGYSGLIQFLKLLINGALMIVICSFLSLSGYFTQATEVT